jgi:hypothetical protein
MFLYFAKLIEILDIPTHVPSNNDSAIHAFAASATVVPYFPRSSQTIVTQKFHPSTILDGWPFPCQNVKFDILCIVHLPLITAALDFRGMAIGHVRRRQSSTGLCCALVTILVICGWQRWQWRNKMNEGIIFLLWGKAEWERDRVSTTIFVPAMPDKPQ